MATLINLAAARAQRQFELDLAAAKKPRRITKAVRRDLRSYAVRVAARGAL